MNLQRCGISSATGMVIGKPDTLLRRNSGRHTIIRWRLSLRPVNENARRFDLHTLRWLLDGWSSILQHQSNQIFLTRHSVVQHYYRKRSADVPVRSLSKY